MEWNGQTVLVTGSSRGIGRAIAAAFGMEGYQVVLNANKSHEELFKTVNDLKEMGIECIGIQADVSDYDECKRMFTEIESKYESPSIIINNAGIAHIGLFSDMTSEQWNRVLDVNFKSVLNCTHIAMMSMIRNKEGVILNISSIWGNRGASCEAVYSASKGAVNSFTKAMAKELGPSGIRVNAISCGLINTDMNNCLNAVEKSILKGQTALLRIGETEEVAQLAVFLASDKADYITGQIITIDGCMD